MPVNGQIKAPARTVNVDSLPASGSIACCSEQSDKTKAGKFPPPAFVLIATTVLVFQTGNRAWSRWLQARCGAQAYSEIR